ncbi:hypothetical protein M2152_000906 [Microbacteriaceae bacterium SG_E_30_P1]|uniref:Uncharacterized protein n=1 Tax=Antiquaquibacter oligotrophicus TaxID=2880260 RepID=A0ABT6KLJ7_9MICO|nr:hypothetical protein [Antiquaquibacter oligotrophicus]MDH6180724.1 hypothetical protein [Antiquaquibacter oligotrophicus]UDF13550.1 hypothetical protein LH407_01485 [Antiquaquibacter oligotrophicus]
MTDDKNNDPGWWRRGLSSRAQVGLFVVAGAIIVGLLIFAVASGIRLF